MREVASLRAVLGTLAWKASQTGPSHQAKVFLFFSFVPVATVDTIVTANKLVHEMKKEASHSRWFPDWSRDG